MTKKKNVFVEVSLSEPLTRDDKTISTITLRKPNTGELRGTKLLDVMQMDVAALTTIIPRISEPAITEADIAIMDIADITAMGLEVTAFLGKEQK